MNFVYINHNVLDNLFYIIVSILMFFVLYDNVSRLKKYKQILLTACMSLPIILCMKFPIYIDQYCVHDLRQIPLFIGTLYGGWPTGAALLIILLVSRFAIYGFNFLTLIVYVVIFIATAFFSTKFNRVNKKKKLLFSAAITLLLEIITTYMAVAMSDFFKVTEPYIFYFIILPPVIVFFAVYLLEILMDTIHVRSNMVKLEKMEVVSQLAASISHEVRNPLTVVKGFIELLKDPNLSQEKKEQYIEHVARELNNAETIISDYLAFAKPATEKVEPISVESEFKNIIEILKPWANMNSVKIKDQLVSGSVLGNANYFRQCFLNIMKNGVEAMPNGGELKIATFLNKNDLTIKVSDTGVGMTKEQINRFGEPYYSSKEKGTGLGSMVAVKTIQMMKGKLEIESVPNEGTTLAVTFPVYLAEKAKVKENPIKLETEFLRS
ncbi:HAMP domain-containing sensor histidine kinase [Bacillus salipaludis]|uniref:histidine kinase n=1 Tax=Bacillus salipaludis TaxID=2547811 RepID=A0AA90R8U6_9BACI|nr:HAMP domain-containing sensor histidine kinase [Bacillus salipaludis]MDQ6598791.1 HAMP domain-containing sensor histidine kinase [Bacillus salipaludis]